MSVLSKIAVAASIADFEVKKLFRALIGIDTVTALGTTLATGVYLVSRRNVVLAADGTVGVVLPRGLADMDVEIVNTVSNQTLKVYPYSSSEQINAITAGSAFSLVGGARGHFYCDADGHWYVAAANLTGTSTSSSTAELDTLHSVTAGTVSASKAIVAGASKNLDTLLINLFGFGSGGIENLLTAGAGGTQASGSFALSATKTIHRFTIVATAADSAILPAATGSGLVHIVINDDLSGATSMQLFAAATETIDDITSATGVAIAATKRRILIDTAAGKWTSILGA